MRKEVKWFAEEMEKQLKANENRKRLKQAPIPQIYSYLEGNSQNLWEIIKDSEGTKDGYENAIKTCSDIANYAMMIADKFKEFRPTCQLINTQFSWMLIVDGLKIPISGAKSVEYFEKHYSSLGYNVEIIEEYQN